MATVVLRHRNDAAGSTHSNLVETGTSDVTDVLDRIIDKGIVINGPDHDDDMSGNREDSFSLLGVHVITAETDVEVHPLQGDGDGADETPPHPRAA